jgi:opacity protein-like surface antigen
MKQDKWTERLEKHLADYREEPKRDLWEGIEASLDKEVKRQHRLVSLRRWMAAAVFVGLTTGGGYLFWHQQPVKEEQQHDAVAEVYESVENPKQEESFVAQAITLKSTASSRITPTAETSASTEESVDTEESVTTEESVATEESTPVVNEYHKVLHKKTEEQKKQPTLEVFEEKNPAIHHNRKLSMNLYASGAMGSWKGQNGVMMSSSMQQKFAFTRGEPVYLVDYEERQDHKQPISFGLTLSYPITKRLSVSTGAVYTRLSSDFLTIVQNHQIKRHQVLHYVGIPLNLQFSVWQWRGLDLYLAAGGQVDWNVAAKANTDGVDQKMDKDRMQWSIGGSLGVQYHIVPQVGLYAEPGIRYYFNNGSSISNFYKDKPTNFNLQLGLRFDF